MPPTAPMFPQSTPRSSILSRSSGSRSALLLKNATVVLALQLRFCPEVSLLCGGLMGAAPDGPGDDGSGFDVALRQARDDTADFLHRPADQRRPLRIIVRLLFGGAAVLAWRRMAASIA